MSHGKRNIKIQKLNLDPLSEWFYSRRVYGDINGDKLTDSDDSLTEQFLVGQINNTKQTYVISQGDDLGDFGVSSVKDTQLQPTQNTLYRAQNKYIYREPQTSYDLYSSFSSRILQNLLSTADKVFELSQPNDFFGLRDRLYRVPLSDQSRPSAPDAGNSQVIYTNLDNPRFVLLEGESNLNLNTFFIEVIHGLTPSGPQEGERRVQNGGLVSSYEANIYDFVYGAITDIQNPIYNRGENREEIIKITKFLLLKSLINSEFITKEQVFSLMADQVGYQYEYANVNTSTPYVKNRSNARILQNQQYENFESTPSSIRPEYGFYEEEYEKSIKPDNIFEDLLPNLYVRKFYQIADSVAAIGREVSQKVALKREYRRLLTLADDIGNIEGIKGDAFTTDLQNSIGSGIVKDYYFLYSSLLDSSDPTYQFATLGLLEKNREFIIGHKDMLNTGLSLAGSAMALNVGFTRDRENQDFSNFINLRLGNDPSIAIFENLKSFSNQGDFDFDYYLYSTEYMLNGGQRETPVLNTSFVKYNVLGNMNSVFNSIPERYTTTPLQRKNKLPIQDDLDDAQRFISNNLRRRSPLSYNEIISGVQTPSEVLGYRIDKRRAGNPSILQTIYLGNAGRRKINYKDTQVKYGLSYTYSLSEFRLIYSSKYNTWTVSDTLPIQILMGYLGLRNQIVDAMRYDELQSFSFENVSNFQPNVELLEIPVYDDTWNRSNVFSRIMNDNPFSPINLLGISALQERGAGGIAFPKTSIMDLPPTAPTMQFFPRAYIDNQVDINITPVSGKIGTTDRDNGSWDQELEIVSIGDNPEKIEEMKEYQDFHSSSPLGSKLMRYQFKGESQIRNVTFYRTTGLDLDVEEYKDLYSSFNPDSNDDVVVRKYSTKTDLTEDERGIEQILSYDIRDTIRPNINYFYTCVVEDVHGNISNPSEIVRVRLYSENGMVIPEISTVIPVGSNSKSNDKLLSRYLKIDASSIQTFPITTQNNGNVESKKSLGTLLGEGKQLEDQSYIVRLTSKDTGRKFDLKLNFVVRVNGIVQGGNT
tara:strand:- start:3754 stop:6879 length:3126 start_codon:yes stop_codon:yes gene_type:complete